MKRIANKSLGKHWVDPRLKIGQSSIQGKGVFTINRIHKNEVVMKWGGELFTMQDVKAGKAKIDSLSGYKEGLFLGQPIDKRDTLDQFLNHSCDSNLWMLDEITIATKKDINPGEELTIDYALFELDENWLLSDHCNCGSFDCRGTVTGLDWRLPLVQNKYKNHFLPYINERIKVQTILFENEV